jgi:type IV pilus biogenesis protein CpaD/CtpE
MRRHNCTSTLLVLTIALGGCASADTEPDFHHAPPPSCVAEHAAKEAWRPGCATHRNLTIMAARQDDLYLARPEAPRDAMRRDSVIGNYAQSSNSAAGPAGTPGAASPSSGAGSTQ